VFRMDALRATEPLLADTEEALEPVTFYTCLRLMIVSGEEARAWAVLDAQAGALLRRDTAASVVFELTRLRTLAESALLRSLLAQVLERVKSGVSNEKMSRKSMNAIVLLASSLPIVSSTAMEMEHSPSSNAALAATLERARTPNGSPASRLAEAVMALFVASNIYDVEGLDAAIRAVNAVRHSLNVNPFDLERSDLIYHTSVGDRASARESAWRLVAEARQVKDITLACVGLRNAAAALGYFGELGHAQNFLLESRLLASRLEYHAQVMRADTLLGGLCLFQMDLEGANAYLESAEEIMFVQRIRSSYLCTDLRQMQCWHAIVRGDHPRAFRFGRASLKLPEKPTYGTAYLTALSTRLAIHTGKHTRQSNRDFERLALSIGSRPFYEGEQLSIAALLLYAKDTDLDAETLKLATTHCARIKDESGTIWGFLNQLVTKTDV